jgi:hypothetical protein
MIVATVGALLLSIIVPVAETVPLMLKVSSTSSIVSAVVGTDTVPVVAPAGTVTVYVGCNPPLPYHLLNKGIGCILCRRVVHPKPEFHISCCCSRLIATVGALLFRRWYP